MSKWECEVCGYIYDPERGDPENGIDPGTSFEDLPDDWVCPQCGVSKEFFQKRIDLSQLAAQVKTYARQGDKIFNLIDIQTKD